MRAQALCDSHAKISIYLGTIRLCDMRAQALCDSHAKMFEEPEDPTNRY